MITYLVHQEWTNSKWPNLIRLKNSGLVCVFFFFGILVFVPVFTFCLLSLPYGWPETSFFIAVPKSKQILVYSAMVTSFLLPVGVSCVLYVFVYYTVITKETNKVGTVVANAEANADPSSLCDEIFVGPSQFCESRIDENYLTNEKKEMKNNAERLSALRSLKTNLYFIFLSIFPLSIFILLTQLSRSNRVFLCVQYYSVNKCVMTVFTTVANFGTIREMMTKFWNVLKERKMRFF